MTKVSISKSSSLIVFIGSMNAMPMVYAIELKKLGYDVLYFVDRPPSDLLCRPENHFASISYPYPEWIIELPLKTQMFLPFRRRRYARQIEHLVSLRRVNRPTVYFLNGFFISLAPFFDERAVKIALSAGSDLDSWADEFGASDLAIRFRDKSIFQFLPGALSRRLISMVVHRQFQGACNCKFAIYFPRGFNSIGDRVLDALESRGVEILPRYDVSFAPLAGEMRNIKPAASKLVIFSGVRFTYLTFPEANPGYNKGNDIIIRGLAKYRETNGNIEVHFVEKGSDVESAKKLCRDTGLEPVVVWHREMKFVDLLALYRSADVCFDQVGQHWIGAIGAYALWLGKPLIANDSVQTELGLWPHDNPICTAFTPDMVCSQLQMLGDFATRQVISEKSKEFAEIYFSPMTLLRALLEFH